MRSREWCLDALSYSELLYHINDQRGLVIMRSLHIRGTIGVASPGGRVAGGQGSPSAPKLVLSPLGVGFSVVFTEDNPIPAVLAQPAVCFDLQDWFLNTDNGVKRRADLQSIERSHPFLARQLLRCASHGIEQ